MLERVVFQQSNFSKGNVPVACMRHSRRFQDQAYGDDCSSTLVKEEETVFRTTFSPPSDGDSG